MKKGPADICWPPIPDTSKSEAEHSGQTELTRIGDVRGAIAGFIRQTGHWRAGDAGVELRGPQVDIGDPLLIQHILSESGEFKAIVFSPEAREDVQQGARARAHCE